MTAVPVLATHVRKARRESTCTLCSGVVKVGQQIARCPGGLWVHAACFIGHRHHVDVPGDSAGAAPARRTTR